MGESYGRRYVIHTRRRGAPYIRTSTVNVQRSKFNTNTQRCKVFGMERSCAQRQILLHIIAKSAEKSQVRQQQKPIIMTGLNHRVPYVLLYTEKSSDPCCTLGVLRRNDPSAEKLVNIDLNAKRGEQTVYVCRGGSREGGSDQRVLLSTTHRDGLDYVRGSLRRRWHYSYHSSCRTHEVSDQGPGYTRCQERGVGSRSSLAPCPP